MNNNKLDDRFINNKILQKKIGVSFFLTYEKN